MWLDRPLWAAALCWHRVQQAEGTHHQRVFVPLLLEMFLSF